MNSFRRTLNFLEVKEVELVGRNYTWSNNQAHPTLTRIDRAFCTLPWEDMFLNPMLHALSPSAFDHCSILLCHLCPPKVTPKFRFETFRASMYGFQDCISEAWSREVSLKHDPLKVLHIKLSRTAKALSVWSKTLIPQGRLAMAIYNEIIEKLEEAQEHRQLS
jgi:hypothetical protein